MSEHLPAHFRVRDALKQGFTREALAAADWHAPYWGVRSRVQASDVRDRAHAFLPRLPERAFYFGPTAAELHGIPIPHRTTSQALHVGVQAGDRRVEARGVVAHHVTIDPRDVTVLNGLPVTTPARTWCDLAAGGLRRHEVIAAGDRILWADDPLGTVHDLRTALARYEGRRGSKLMRDALPALSSGSASPPETWLRVLVIDAGLPVPSVQVEVANRWGRVLGHCDLGWPALRLGLEYEGDHHRTDAAQWRYDVRRYGEMQEAGWFIIRVTADDLRDSHARAMLLNRIRSAISARVRTLLP